MKPKRIKVRRTWGSLRPTERIHGSPKGYHRHREKRAWKKELAD